MKINKFGTVTITTSNPRIEGWLIEREPEDPKDATNEQLLTAFAITWARERFEACVRGEEMQAFREKIKASLPKKLDA